MKDLGMFTNEVIRAVEAEAEYRMIEGHKMSILVAWAYAAGYAGHRGVDLLRLNDAIEDLYQRKTITDI